MNLTLGMNQVTTLLLFVAFAFGCTPKQKQMDKASSQVIANEKTIEILIEVKTDDKEDLEIFENGIIPWISIKEPENQLDNLVGKDEIVITATEAILLIDYPLNKPTEIAIRSEKSEGFRKAELVQIISREYNRIYLEEEESATEKTIPLEERTGLINRNKTNGKYGIWGHDIGDLDLSSIIVHLRGNAKPKLELYIES